MHSTYAQERKILPRDLHALVSNEICLHISGGFKFSISRSANVLRTLLFAPFIPFIVIFCHVIETQDETDLARLQAFVTSIQSASSISGPAAKLHRLFQVLCRIAVGYVKFRFSATPLDGRQDSSKIDTYLDALGFSSASACIPGRQHHLIIPQHDSSNREVETNDARTGADAANDELRVMNPMMWMANSAELEEWLENNEVMTGSI
jgi:hypothetical protein